MPNLTIDRAVILIQEAIDLKTRHAGYQRTIDLRDTYRTITRGTDFQRFLLRYKKRETEEEYTQRLELTKQNLSATSSPIMRKAGQISRVQDIKKGINYSGTSERDQRDLQAVLDDFGGEGTVQQGSLDDYLTHRYDEPSQIDPNAFIVLEFGDYNADRGERARPYGVFYDCEMVYNFRYTRGVLDYLLVGVEVGYTDKDNVKRTATDLILYAGNYIIRYFLAADGRQDLPDTNQQWKSTSGATYRIQFYNPGVVNVPAVRIGDMPDPETGGLTCVSRLLHASIDQFKELIDLKSQNDIVTKKHGFPRRYERAPLCPGEILEGGLRASCDNGINRSTGVTCKACGGSGFAVHKSEQDTVRLELTGNEDVSELYDLSKLVFTEQPALESIKAFDQKIRDKIAEINVTIYASDQQVQVNGPAKTATEYVVSREDQNNTLLPIADYKSSIYKALVGHVVAIMRISGEVEVLYEFPRDLKLSSISDLYADLKAARDAGAPDFEIEQILDDIARKRYEADPSALRKYFIKKQHVPYYAQSLDQFEYFESTGLVPRNLAVLRANVDVVFGELEIENPTFYELPYIERDKLVSAKVEKLQGQLQGATVFNLNSARPEQQQQFA